MIFKDQANDICGCCKGIEVLTPATTKNLPGLAALAYRVGTHGSFKTTMKAALSEQRTLDKLTIRNDDDPSIALIDAWAYVLDVLTFYQERIANEGYLLTASERKSILELSRAIGYELKPGVAASTFLAFIVEDAPGTPGYATIDAGVKIMSIPGQNEKPQTFETIEKIEARAAWNELKPRMTEQKIPGEGSKDVYLKGTALGLKPGDRLLFLGKEREINDASDSWTFRIVKTVTTDMAAGYTHVAWEKQLGCEEALPAKDELKVYAFRLRASLFGHNAPDWLAMPDSIKKAYLGLKQNGPLDNLGDQWPSFNIHAINGLCAEYFNDINLENKIVKRIDPNVDFDWEDVSPHADINSDCFSVRWTGFLQPTFTGSYTFYTVSDDGVKLFIDNKSIIDDWSDHPAKENSGTMSDLEAGKLYCIVLEYYENKSKAKIQLYWSSDCRGKKIIPESQLYPPNIIKIFPSGIYLDAIYEQILPGSWLLLSIPGCQRLYRVNKVSEELKANYTLVTKTTHLELGGNDLLSFNCMLRETEVFAQSEQLEIAEAPRSDLLSGNIIDLDSYVPGLEKGRLLIINGKRMNALVTWDAAGLDLISEDGEKKTVLWTEDLLQVMEPPVKMGDKVKWKLIDRNGFKGSVIAPDGSILLKPAALENPVVSEVATIEGIFENALPKKLKVVEEAFKGDVENEACPETIREAFENGCYQVVGWNGESYVALGGQVNKLARLVLEQDADEKKVVNEGETWDIEGGWKLSIQEITTQKKTNQNQALLILTKDGIEKGRMNVTEGSVYTFVEKNIADETDVPFFVTYLDTIFSESNSNLVVFKYTWVVGTDITEINIGDKFTAPDSSAGTRERTILVLKKEMENSYDPFTVTINANVARATHGETVHEVLGSGNGAQANQRFTLNKQPVTYVSAPTPSGTQSTIEVRVNGVKWQEVRSLYGLDDRARCYITRTDEEGRSTLVFGDAKNGSRLPTGQENISATYRTGIGKQGLLRSGQLSLLMTRPLGVKGVINPLAPTGAEDPEGCEQAKQNAPQKVLTLDRIVSLQDFEDFTRTFAGIGKAQATWLCDGEKRFVHITVAAGSAGMVENVSEKYHVDKTSDLYKNLMQGIENVKDPVQQFQIDSFKPLLFSLSASVLVNANYIKEKVLAAVADALKQVFSFEKRSFGQNVTESEVLAVMQRVEGIEAVDLDALYMKGEPPCLNTYLKASRARQEKGFLLPGELLTLHPEGLELTEMIL